MSKIVTYKNEGSKGVFCQIKLDSGERVLVSVYEPMQVKVIKVWLGIIPIKTIWGPKSVPEVLELFFNKDKQDKSVLDVMVNRILNCKSIKEIKNNLTEKADKKENEL